MYIYIDSFGECVGMQGSIRKELTLLSEGQYLSFVGLHAKTEMQKNGACSATLSVCIYMYIHIDRYMAVHHILGFQQVEGCLWESSRPILVRIVQSTEFLKVWWGASQNRYPREPYVEGF